MTERAEVSEAVLANIYRDGAGFSRRTETWAGSGTWYAIGPDDCSHSIHCDFIRRRGILPCNCDATREEYPQPAAGVDGRPASWWYRCWFRWQEVRVSPYEHRERVPWPVQGPDEEPWVEGQDFDD